MSSLRSIALLPLLLLLLLCLTPSGLAQTLNVQLGFYPPAQSSPFPAAYVTQAVDPFLQGEIDLTIFTATSDFIPLSLQFDYGYQDNPEAFQGVPGPFPPFCTTASGSGQCLCGTSDCGPGETVCQSDCQMNFVAGLFNCSSLVPAATGGGVYTGQAVLLQETAPSFVNRSLSPSNTGLTSPAFPFTTPSGHLTSYPPGRYCIGILVDFDDILFENATAVPTTVVAAQVTYQINSSLVGYTAGSTFEDYSYNVITGSELTQTGQGAVSNQPNAIWINALTTSFVGPVVSSSSAISSSAISSSAFSSSALSSSTFSSSPVSSSVASSSVFSSSAVSSSAVSSSAVSSSAVSSSAISSSAVSSSAISSSAISSSAVSSSAMSSSAVSSSAVSSSPVSSSAVSSSAVSSSAVSSSAASSSAVSSSAVSSSAVSSSAISSSTVSSSAVSSSAPSSSAVSSSAISSSAVSSSAASSSPVVLSSSPASSSPVSPSISSSLLSSSAVSSSAVSSSAVSSSAVSSSAVSSSAVSSSAISSSAVSSSAISSSAVSSSAVSSSPVSSSAVSSSAVSSSAPSSSAVSSSPVSSSAVSSSVISSSTVSSSAISSSVISSSAVSSSAVSSSAVSSSAVSSSAISSSAPSSSAVSSSAISSSAVSSSALSSSVVSSSLGSSSVAVVTSAASPTRSGGTAAVVIGDPQFSGLLGQSFQVHGTPSTHYAIISTPAMHLNALFELREQGRCTAELKQRTACWSHTGNYFASLTLTTRPAAALTLDQANDLIDRATSLQSVPTIDAPVELVASAASTTLEVVAGPMAEGLRVTFAGAQLPPSPQWRALRLSSDDAFVFVYFSDPTHLLWMTTEFLVRLDNSDRFINTAVLMTPTLAQRVDAVQTIKSEALREVAQSSLPHGLLGQTWSERRWKNRLQVVEGDVDDYSVAGATSADFPFSRFA